MSAPPSQRIPECPVTRNLIAILKRHVAPPAARPFAVDLGLAAGIFCAWLALCGFSPVVAAAARRVAPGRDGPAPTGCNGLPSDRRPSALRPWSWRGSGIARPLYDRTIHERLQRASLLAAALLDPAPPRPLRSARLRISLPDPSSGPPTRCGLSRSSSSDTYICHSRAHPGPLEIPISLRAPCSPCACRSTCSTRSTSARSPCSIATRASTCG